MVIDTNVAISAAISPGGPPAAIIRAWARASFTWIISPALLEEAQRVFARPKVAELLDWSPDLVADFLLRLEQSEGMVEPGETLDVIKSDPSDNRLVEAAIAGEADYIVTGDAHLLTAGEYEGVSIVTPARFLAILSTLRP